MGDTKEDIQFSTAVILPLTPNDAQIILASVPAALAWRPAVVRVGRIMWQVDEHVLESICIGAGVLGAGGGGNPYVGQISAREAIRKWGPVDVVSPEELGDDESVISVATIGAPTVLIEKMPDIQPTNALLAMEEYSGTKATALIPVEIGGVNSVEPFIPAAMKRLPVVDGDGMGRAFPELQLITFFVYGVSPTPLAVSDEKGNTAIITEGLNPVWVERLARAVCVQIGSIGGFATVPMTTEQIRKTAVPYTLSLARDVGDAVKRARVEREDPVAAILETSPGKVLFQGKIVDLDRRTTGGWSRGAVTIDGLGEYLGERMKIDIQNENIIARRDGKPVCTVPDLICIVDTERGESITTELLRYGFRVTVLGLPAPALWTTPEGLAVAGPRCFRYDMDYAPLTL